MMSAWSLKGCESSVQPKAGVRGCTAISTGNMLCKGFKVYDMGRL